MSSYIVKFALCATAIAVGAGLLLPPAAQAASGTWKTNGSGNWSNTTL